jgi:hypothetical protein
VPRYGWGLAGQDEESGLKRVLGVVPVAQHAPANAQNHRAVSSQQGPKRGLVVLLDKTLEQIPVRQLSRDRLDPKAEVLEDGSDIAVDHCRRLPEDRG